MALNFANIDLLSYNHQSNFLGENILRFKITKEITLQGNLLDLINTSGVSGIWSGLQALEISTNDWQELLINGVSFGSGIITSIDFDAGNDIQKKRYTVNLEIYDSGSILNFPSNDLYSGINYNNFRYIQDLNETISYSNNFDTKIYNHNISVGILTNDINTSKNIAQLLASNLFNANNILNVLGQYNTLGNKKSIYSENYDDINGNYSFDRNTTLYKNTSGNYTINKNYNFQRNEDGIITVSEKGEILALEEPYIDVLTNAYQQQISFAFSNCQDVFNSYKQGDNYVLENTPLTKGTSTNRFERKMNYEFSFSNNLNISDGFFWEYTHESDLNEKGLIQSKENGRIIGFGHIVNEKYNAAKLGYNSIKSQIIDRTTESYERFKSFNPNFSNTSLNLISRTETFSVYNGQISYNWNYNNDQNMLTGVNNLTRAEVTYNESYQVPITQSFNIPNLYELEQVSQAYEVAERSVEIEINGNRNASISDYINYFKVIANNYSGDFLTDVNYSYDPYNNIFNGNIIWGKIY